jgi:hypothetical protein
MRKHLKRTLRKKKYFSHKHKKRRTTHKRPYKKVRGGSYEQETVKNVDGIPITKGSQCTITVPGQPPQECDEYQLREGALA